MKGWLQQHTVKARLEVYLCEWKAVVYNQLKVISRLYFDNTPFRQLCVFQTDRPTLRWVVDSEWASVHTGKARVSYVRKLFLYNFLRAPEYYTVEGLKRAYKISKELNMFKGRSDLYRAEFEKLLEEAVAQGVFALLYPEQHDKWLAHPSVSRLTRQKFDRWQTSRKRCLEKLQDIVTITGTNTVLAGIVRDFDGWLREGGTLEKLREAVKNCESRLCVRSNSEKLTFRLGTEKFLSSIPTSLAMYIKQNIGSLLLRRQHSRGWALTARGTKKRALISRPGLAEGIAILISQKHDKLDRLRHVTRICRRRYIEHRANSARC